MISRFDSNIRVKHRWSTTYESDIAADDDAAEAAEAEDAEDAEAAAAWAAEIDALDADCIDATAEAPGEPSMMTRLNCP